MEKESSSNLKSSRITSAAFILSRVLSIPFWVMLNTLPVILYKEFHVSPFVLTLYIALKPATAILATYWSCFFNRHEKFLVPNLILANCLRFLPFLFFYWFSSPWPLLLSFCLYMTLSRGAVPAWTEMFKRHISGESQSKVFSLGNTLQYLGTTLVPLFLGMLLDINSQSWRLLFPLTALLGLVSTVLLVRLPNQEFKRPPPPPKNLFLPWKRAYAVLKDNPSFRNYQMGFMLGGAGLMILQPILPHFFVDVLDLSYTKMILAITVCKGIGFTLTSPFWVSLFKKRGIFPFSALVALLAGLFPLLLLGAKGSVILIYVAYLLYGIMQSGSELSWHMSPVVFSNEQESFDYSETNILSVGVRGCFIPFLGSLLFTTFNSFVVLLVATLFCFLGSRLLYHYSAREISLA